MKHSIQGTFYHQLPLTQKYCLASKIKKMFFLSRKYEDDELYKERDRLLGINKGSYSYESEKESTIESYFK